MRGLLASLGINQHALRWMFGSAEASSSFQLKTSFAVRTFQNSRTICKSFIAKSSLHGLHKRACAGVCAFVVVDVACKKQVLLNARACAAGMYAHKLYATQVS